MADEEELTTSQIRDLVKVSRVTVVKHIQSGKLKAYKRMSAYRIKRSDFEKWASAQNLNY